MPTLSLKLLLLFTQVAAATFALDKGVIAASASSRMLLLVLSFASAAGILFLDARSVRKTASRHGPTRSRQQRFLPAVELAITCSCLTLAVVTFLTPSGLNGSWIVLTALFGAVIGLSGGLIALRLGQAGRTGDEQSAGAID